MPSRVLLLQQTPKLPRSWTKERGTVRRKRLIQLFTDEDRTQIGKIAYKKNPHKGIESAILHKFNLVYISTLKVFPI